MSKSIREFEKFTASWILNIDFLILATICKLTLEIKQNIKVNIVALFFCEQTAKLLFASDSHTAPRRVQQKHTLEWKVVIRTRFRHFSTLFFYLVLTYIGQSREKISNFRRQYGLCRYSVEHEK